MTIRLEEHSEISEKDTTRFNIVKRLQWGLAKLAEDGQTINCLNMLEGTFFREQLKVTTAHRTAEGNQAVWKITFIGKRIRPTRITLVTAANGEADYEIGNITRRYQVEQQMTLPFSTR